MSYTGNKGEWSEVYVLLKLLGEKVLYSGDEDLNKVADLFFPILSIIREEQNKNVKYAINGNIVLLTENGELFDRIPIGTFLSYAKLLLEKIRTTEGRSFSVPFIENFLNEIHCYRIKAKPQDKADIRIVVHDPRTRINPELGFSIKSYLGGKPTLLNPGPSTNFIYRITNIMLNDEEINFINEIDTSNKIQDRIKIIYEKGGRLEYYSMQHKTFENNLLMIDSCMPLILSDMLRVFFSTEYTGVSEIVSAITRENPLNYDLSLKQPFYEHKVKQLLVDIALGMTPATPWDGRYDATGGYIVVKSNGDLVCYHIYDRNMFEDYMFKNTKLVSASSSRYNYGSITRQGKDLLLKLNLQIRFR